MYYLKTQGEAYTAYEIRKKVGLDPSVATNLDILNSVGVYPVSNPDYSPTFDARLYNHTTTYTINNQYADKSVTLYGKPLSEAREAAYIGLKQKYESQIKSIVNDWGRISLIAIATKAAVLKTDEETDVINDMTALSNSLAVDIDAVQAASDVTTINSILNS